MASRTSAHLGRHPEYKDLITHVFDVESDYLDGDAVFGVQRSLIREFKPDDNGELATTFDIVLDRVLTQLRARNRTACPASNRGGTAPVVPERLELDDSASRFAGHHHGESTVHVFERQGVRDHPTRGRADPSATGRRTEECRSRGLVLPMNTPTILLPRRKPVTGNVSSASSDWIPTRYAARPGAAMSNAWRTNAGLPTTSNTWSAPGPVISTNSSNRVDRRRVDGVRCHPAVAPLANLVGLASMAMIVARRQVGLLG